MKICFASNNAHKLEEIVSIMPGGFVLVGLNELGVTEDIPETGTTLEENSLLKAKYIFDRYQLPVFADDTGLEVEVLKGEPGVYSARYAGPLRNADDNMNLLLSKLELASNRNACFKTIVTYINSEGQISQFAGQINGIIAKQKAGDLGFGYDPIFIPEGFERTFAELDSTEKNAISHRARAIKKFIDYLSAL